MTMKTYSPDDETALAGIIENAGKTGDTFRILGGGSRATLGNPVAHTAILSTQNIRGVRLYEPEALTLVVAAGTPLAEVESLLDANGQHLPFEPADYREILHTQDKTPLIGALAACNISGPRRIVAGACRDSMIGLRAITGRGQIIKNGGRVMKNVTGYDLVKLLAGSFGTLAVISELAFKTLPKPEVGATLCLNGLNDNDAVGCLSAALNSPYQITGAAHVPNGLGGSASITLIRIEGFADSVRYRTDALKDHLGKVMKGDIKTDITVETNPDISANLWQSVKNLHPFIGKTGDIWQIGMKSSDAADFGKAMRDLTDTGTPCEYFFDWGGARAWVLCPLGFDLREHALKTPKIIGYATRLRGNSDKTKDKTNAFPPLTPAIKQIQTDLRTKFDPHTLLNSGIMG